MLSFTNPWFSISLIVASLLLLAPSTATLLWAFYVLIAGAITGQGLDQMGRDEVVFFIAVAVFLALETYGLVAMWWLVAKQRRLTLQAIPKAIWGGLGVGGVLALGMTYMNFIHSAGPFEWLVLGAGPLLMLAGLMAVLYLRD